MKAVTFRLPSGALCTRVDEHPPDARVRYFIATGHGCVAMLSTRDIEAVYAYSIAEDGGRELPADHKCGCPIGGCCLACCCGESHP